MRKSKTLAATAVAFALGVAGSASATVTLDTNPGGQLSWMLFNDGTQGPGSSVQLDTKNSPIDYFVTATGNNISTTGNGFALISGNPSFSSITFTPDNPLVGFDKFQLTLSADSLAPNNPTPTFQISWTSNIGSGSFNNVDLSGNKAYELDAVGEYLTSITIDDLVGGSGHPVTVGAGSFDQAKQVSFEGPVAVPEPATWGMMLVGFLGTGALLRNRRKMLSTTPA